MIFKNMALCTLFVILFITISEVSAETKFVSSPMQQISEGVKTHEVECKYGLLLVVNAFTKDPVCLKYQSADILIDVGWAVSLQYAIENFESIRGDLTDCEIKFVDSKLYNRVDHLQPTSLMVDGEKLYVDGYITCTTPEKLQRIIQDNPQVTTIVPVYVPGSADDEAIITLSSWMRDQNLNTHLESKSYIESGGIDFFLSGVSRTMETGATIVVHSWSDGDVEGGEIPRDDPAHKLYTDYIDKVLGNDEFYWFAINQATYDGIYHMTNEQIMQYRLVTAPIIIPGDEIILYVSAQTKECYGMFLQQCMLIRESLDSEWEYLYDGIVGFDYMPGTEYKLRVIVTHLDDPPADASSIIYTLVEIQSSFVHE